MAPRKRIRRNADLPTNLYANKVNGVTYYRYKRPDTGTWHQMGSIKPEAVASARQLNSILQTPDDLVAKVMGKPDNSVNNLIQRYEDEYLDAQALAGSTRQNAGYRLARFKTDLGDRDVNEFDTRVVADYLDKNFTRDSYVKHRQTLTDLFRFAQTKGLYPSDQPNPVTITYAKGDHDKDRQRMTLEQFKAIHAIAPDWMQIAMELALVTLQSRLEVISMRFSDYDEDTGELRVVRQKVEKHEHAYLLIRSPHLAKIVSRARQSGVVSPFLVHRAPVRRKPAKGRHHWTQIMPNNFTELFREYRDKTDVFDDIPRKNRPTFHEIRSLGSWLYKKQGFDNENYIQPLMAHADEKMTQEYQKGHERAWVHVNAELDINTILPEHLEKYSI